MTHIDSVYGSNGISLGDKVSLTQSGIVVNGTLTADSISGTFDGDIATAQKLATARKISLSGDASGSTSFDGSTDVSISVTVKDDSHNHTISNIDGLSTELNKKLESVPGASNTVIGGFKTGYSESGKNYAVKINTDGTAFVSVPWTGTTYIGTPPITVSGTTISHASSGVSGTSVGPSANANLNYGDTFTVPQLNYNATGHLTSVSNRSIKLPAALTSIAKLTTARTISLGNQLTGSTSFDGSKNVTINANFNPKQLTSEDLNTLCANDKVGFYYAGGGNSVTNKPSAFTSAFGLLVMRSAGGWYTQLAVGADQAINDVYIRSGYNNGSNWNAWEKLAGTGDNVASASKLSSARTITLSGNVTGSVSFDGSKNVTLTATVKDDSHNHTIANIDNLSTELGKKLESVPVATSSAYGGIQIGYSENGKNYPVELSNGKAFVNVPWTNTTYSVATQSNNGLMSSSDKKKLDGLPLSIPEGYRVVTQHSTSTSLTISGYSANDFVTIYRNGLYLVPSTEYTIASNGAVTFKIAAVSGDVHDVVSLRRDPQAPQSTDNYATVSQVDSKIANAFGTITNAVNITNTTASSSTSNGALRVAGGVGVGGNLNVGGNITGGTITGSTVYGAVWNDLADAIEIENDIELEAGKCYILNSGNCYLASSSMEGIPVIHSDTYGFLMGIKENKKCINAALTGFVLAFVDKVYPSGTRLMVGENGYLTKWKFGYDIVAKYYKEEPKEYWYKVKVNNRHWVKVV